MNLVDIFVCIFGVTLGILSREVWDGKQRRKKKGKIDNENKRTAKLQK